jgi:proteasome lid subunit RPN8/RPN11
MSFWAYMFHCRAGWFSTGHEDVSTSSARTGLVVAGTVLNILRAEAALAHPSEACGLLFGSPTQIERATTVRNVHPAPRGHFEIDPAALIAAHKAERAGGPAIAGYWHSHPHGSPEPSATDQANAAGDGKIWAIVAGEAVGFWRDAPGGFEPLSYSACRR